MIKKKSVKSDSSEHDDELSPAWKRDLRRRIADADDPVRYAVFSDITDRGRWRLWLDVSDGVYGMSLDQATLFKKKHVAQAVAKAYSAGRKSPLLLAKITTKSGKRRALKYEKVG